MSLYNGPPRGGTRGGKDQFSWDAVKADKDREYYLGHSVKATTGRWQKGKDVFWYTREKQDEGDAARAELLAVKHREEDLMAEALGIKPKTIRAPKQPSLDQKDLQQLMQKGEEEEEAAEGGDREAERIKGLGFTVNAVRGAGDAEHDVLPGTLPAGGPPQPGGGPNGALPPPPQLSADDAKRLRKAQKRAAKEARRAVKKEEKRAKKALKKAKKLAKKAQVEQQQQQQEEQPEDSGSSSGSGRSDSSQPGSNAQERHGQADPGGRRHREERDVDSATGHGSRPRHESAPTQEQLPVKRRRAASPEERHHRSGREDGHGRSGHGDSPARGDRHGRSRHGDSPARCDRHERSRYGDSPARRAGRAEDRHARDRDGGSPSRHMQRRSRSPEYKARQRG